MTIKVKSKKSVDGNIIRSKNILFNKKRTLEIEINRDTETVNRLRKNDTMDVEYLKERINKIKEIKKKREEELKEIDERIKKLERGGEDEEIEKDKIKQSFILKEKLDEVKRKKDTIVIEKNKNKEDSDKRWKIIRNTIRDDKQLARDIRYFYKQFNRIDESLPTYIRNNLKTMPNNKGYIWRGCTFYGEKPYIEGSPDIIFEKKKGNILVIKEVGEDYIRVYEKKGKDRKVLVINERRVKNK